MEFDYDGGGHGCRGNCDGHFDIAVGVRIVEVIVIVVGAV